MKRKVLIFCLLLINCFFNLTGATDNIVFVHGAWHGSWSWFEVEPLLAAAGYNVESILLPGHDGITPGSVTLQDYTDAVIEYLDTLEQPVILAGHSMGGAVISSVAEARPERIEKLVYIAAFLLQDGQSLLDIALLDTGSEVLPRLEVDDINGLIKVDTAFREEMFYHLSLPKYTILTEDLLVPNPLQPFGTPLVLSPGNFGSVRRFYITTTHDNAVSPSIQELMYTSSPCEEVFEIETDHSPFFSDPEQLADILMDIAEETSSPIIENGEFDDSKNPWQFQLDGKSEAVFSINTGSRLSGVNSAEAAVVKGGSKSEDVMLYQDIPPLQQGTTYTIGFSGITDHTGTKNIDVKLLDSSGTVCWEITGIKLNNTVQSFGSYSYTCSTESSSFRLAFCLGKGNNLNIYVDNVFIEAGS